MAKVPEQVEKLVEQFDRNAEQYKNPAFNETECRVELVNPFWKALGWDVDNTAGYALPYRDVIHEDSVKVGDATKAPDYCFRIGGMRKFFLETKKPSVNLKDDSSPAFQLRRYGWSAKLGVSVLTDFEELAVYDCRLRPKLSDKASAGRMAYYKYTDYIEEWDTISSIFSREAVLRGAFDKYVETSRDKRGSSEVDDEFLKEIEGWRDALAKDIALRNPKIDVRDLNFAVQKTIDRIIFLRMCEDRGIEVYGQLKEVGASSNVYKRLLEVYRLADEKYNSGLFHFRQEGERPEIPDSLTPKLEIDNKTLKGILSRLYYPESPYEFSILPADILGNVYEQFLGKVIRLTSAHQAKVEEKPEVRKAGGVYYTPAYIVDYIVKNTVGKLCEGKAPAEVSKLRVLDPACGSGSFLLGAYQYLLDWHLRWYLAEHQKLGKVPQSPPAEGTRKKKGDPQAIHETKKGWLLTTTEKKRILLNNIYGVDIDPQAVEVTKLSLLLKVLEDENRETLQSQMKLWGERALPDLADNIRCGNSLVGPDFYQTPEQAQLFADEDLRRRVNAFNWNADQTGFGEILRTGGFDAVIGNPPYVRQESLKELKNYFSLNYASFDSAADLYVYFMEKGVALLRTGGLFSIIVSASFLRATYGQGLRQTLMKNAAVLRIVDFGGLAVFASASDTYVCIPLLAKGVTQPRVEIAKVASLEIRQLDDYVSANHYTIPPERLTPESWALRSDQEAALLDKIMNCGISLGEYVETRMYYGLKTGLNEAFEISDQQRNALLKGSKASACLIKRFLGGQNIRRYYNEGEPRYLITIPSGWTRSEMTKARRPTSEYSEREAWTWFAREHSSIARHLGAFSDALKKRQDKGEYWWELRSCDYYGQLESPKIMFPDICKGPRFCLDRDGIYLANTAYFLGTDDPYLLGFLNSRLFWFAISNLSIPFGVRAGQYRYRLIYQYMEKVPVRRVDPSNKVEMAMHSQVVRSVLVMTDLMTKLRVARSPEQRGELERDISVADKQIDSIFYKLNQLTEAEIAIVDASGVL